MAAGSGLAEPVGVIAVGMLFHDVLYMETILKSNLFVSYSVLI